MKSTKERPTKPGELDDQDLDQVTGGMHIEPVVQYGADESDFDPKKGGTRGGG